MDITEKINNAETRGAQFDLIVDWIKAEDDNANRQVPCSRYGQDTNDCAPVAALAELVMQDVNGEPITEDTIDSSMSLVVNNSDGIEYLIREHGHPVLLHLKLNKGLSENLEDWFELTEDYDPEGDARW